MPWWTTICGARPVCGGRTLRSRSGRRAGRRGPARWGVSRVAEWRRGQHQHARERTGAGRPRPAQLWVIVFCWPLLDVFGLPDDQVTWLNEPLTEITPTLSREISFLEPLIDSEAQ